MTEARSPYQDRARAALLGLACGDAYGRPLEFVRGERARTLRVSIDAGSFRWTDDTHMSTYVAEALRGEVGRPFDGQRFGRAVADAFVRWAHDPLTPSTAPGTTCLAGVRRYEATRDWRTSGVPESDGCGAVMRAGPIGVALRGEALLEAARIQACVTHGHPNAAEAAVACSWLVRRAIDTGRLDAADVLLVCERLRGAWSHGGDVAASLEAGVALSGCTGRWLTERDVPPGDGGWRSGSALGLAVAAALRWRSDFTTAIDRAARIDGDSDSVAALTGLLLGAAGGTAVLPARMVSVLPSRDELVRHADELIRSPRPVRTSATDPLRVDWVTEGVAPGGGAIGVTFAPGKKSDGVVSPCRWERELASDLERLAEVHGCGVLVSLVEDAELERLGIPDLVARAAEHRIAVVRLPVRDQDVPRDEEAAPVIAQAIAAARSGQRVVIHCWGGRGRAGTLAAACLVALGRSPSDAIAATRRARPGAIEARVQERFVHAFCGSVR